MSRIQLVTVTLLALGCAGCTTAGSSPEAISSNAQQLVRSYVDAANNADITAMMEAISRDAGTSSISDGTITRGWEAIRTENDELVGKAGAYSVALGSIDVVPLGSTHALITAPATVTVTTEQGALAQSGAMTLVLARTPKGWKIIHEHFSSQPEQQGD